MDLNQRLRHKRALRRGLPHWPTSSCVPVFPGCHRSDYLYSRHCTERGRFGGKHGIRTHGGITLACLANRCNQPALPASRVKDRCIGLRIALRCLTRPKFARSANLRDFAPVAPHSADVLASCGYGAGDGIRTRVPGLEGRCPASGRRPHVAAAVCRPPQRLRRLLAALS